MQMSSYSNISESIQKQINDFKNMLGYLNQDESLKKFEINESDSPQVQLSKTLSLGKEIQHRIDNPEEPLYQQSLATKVASEFGLQISPMYYGRGISLIDGQKFLNFLSHVSLKDLHEPSIDAGIKSILKHIKCLYGYILEQDLDNDKFDNFHELANCWGDIEKQYERLGMSQHLKNFSMKPYVDAYNGGYLKSLLGLKFFLWDGADDPFKMTKTNSFLDLHDHKKGLENYVDKICEWGEKEVGDQKSSSLVKHVFSLYIETIHNDRNFFNLSDAKVNHILGKFENVLSKL